MKFTPEFAVILPAYGNTPSVVDVQLSIGERQGRQILDVQTYRNVLRHPIPTRQSTGSGAGAVDCQLDRGKQRLDRDWRQCADRVQVSVSDGGTCRQQSLGNKAEKVQLPTRYVTVLAKWFSGTDLRWYFVGQLFSDYNETAGLTGVQTAASIDGSDNVAFGFLNGVATVAPQGGVRATGGFPQFRIPAVTHLQG